MVDLVGNITSFVTEFTNIALSDPLSAILLAVGALMVGGASLVFGYLSVGAAVDLVIPS